MAAAVALANLDVLEREDLLGRVRAHETALRGALDGLRDIPIVGDVRGAGYFWGLELVADPATRRPFDAGDGSRRGGRLPRRRAAPARADLPRRRPRLPRDPARAAADRRPGRVRGDRRDPARRATVAAERVRAPAAGLMAATAARGLRRGLAALAVLADADGRAGAGWGPGRGAAARRGQEPGLAHAARAGGGGLAERDPATRAFRLGPRVFAYAAVVAERRVLQARRRCSSGS